MTMPNDQQPTTTPAAQERVAQETGAPETAVQAAPATPASEGSAVPVTPAAEQQEELIGSWLAAHLDKVDVPFQILVLVLAFLLGSFAATNSDLWMNFATGRLIAEGKYEFGVDPFSYTTEAKEHTPATPWINHSWLSSWLFYGLHGDKDRAADVATESWSMLIPLKALLGVAIAALLLWLIPGSGYRWVTVLCVILAMLTLSPRLLLAPAVFSFLFLAVTVFVLVRAGVLSNSGANARPALLWVLPPLFALWVNMDTWFLLGPLTLVVCLAMLGLEAYQGQKTGPLARTLAAVLVAGLLACLLNPHHMWAVTSLPPELAFLLLKVGDFWPEILVSGGRPLLEFQRVNPNFPQTLTPFSQGHITIPSQGLNIGGIAFFVLFLGVLGSFYLVATTPRRPEGPGWSLRRAGLAIFFGALALMQVRLVPFFAVIGGALAIMNLNEYLSWRGSLDKPKAEEQQLWGNLARLCTGFLLFALLFFTWPGWINRSIGDFASPLRVSWAIETDPSFKATAIYLDRMHQQGKLDRCLNFSPEIASYGSWYAPGVKYFFDYRFQLFGTHIAALNKVYLALQAEASQPEPFRQDDKKDKSPTFDWRATLASYGIDHIAGGGLQTPRSLEVRLLVASWQNPREFQSIYSDGKSAVFWWRNHEAAAKLPDLTEQWRRRVFGRDSQYTPPEGLSSLEEDPGFWKLYLWGRRRSSQRTNEADLYLTYFDVHTRDPRWRKSALYARWITYPALHLGLRTAPFVQDIAFYLPFMNDDRLENSGNFQYAVQARDLGPPEAPILALRAARQGQVDDPQYPATYRSLYYATDMQSRLEKQWGGEDARLNLRLRLRKLQIVAALKHYLLLNPNDYQAHASLAQTVIQPPFYHLDVSLEHWNDALKALESVKTVNLQLYLHERNRLEGERLRLEQEVAKRLEYYELHSAGMSDLQRVQLALFLPYQFELDGNKGVDQNGLGLVQRALQVLETTSPLILSENEKREVIFHRLRLAIETGDLWKVEITLADFQDKLPPLQYLNLKVLLKGALGDTVAAEKALEQIEKLEQEAGHPEDKKVPSFRNRVLLGALQSELVPTFGAFVPASAPRWSELMSRLLHSQENSNLTLGQMVLDKADRTLVRGLFALESGQPVTARALFADALKMAGTLPFADRKIAERYLELLPR